MFSKFAIDYSTLHQHCDRTFTHQTDDPVELEDFIMHLLASGSRIHQIRHEGAVLKGAQFDRLLKVAADRCASEMLRQSLNIDNLAVRDRFGFAA